MLEGLIPPSQLVYSMNPYDSDLWFIIYGVINIMIIMIIFNFNPFPIFNQIDDKKERAFYDCNPECS